MLTRDMQRSYEIETGIKFNMLTSITDQLKISTVATDIYIDRYLPANVLNTMHEIISESVTYKQKY